jgi:hypothetical protein
VEELRDRVEGVVRGKKQDSREAANTLRSLSAKLNSLQVGACPATAQPCCTHPLHVSQPHLNVPSTSTGIIGACAAPAAPATRGLPQRAASQNHAMSTIQYYRAP